MLFSLRTWIGLIEVRIFVVFVGNIKISCAPFQDCWRDFGVTFGESCECGKHCVDTQQNDFTYVIHFFMPERL